MNSEWLLCHLPSIVGLFFSIAFYLLPHIIICRIFAGLRDVGFREIPRFLMTAFHPLTRPLSCSILSLLFLIALFADSQVTESICLSIGFALLILSAIFWTGYMGFLMYIADMANMHRHSPSRNRRQWEYDVSPYSEDRWEDEEDSY